MSPVIDSANVTMVSVSRNAGSAGSGVGSVPSGAKNPPKWQSSLDDCTDKQHGCWWHFSRYIRQSPRHPDPHRPSCSKRHRCDCFSDPNAKFKVICAYTNKGKYGPLWLIKVLRVLLMRVFTTHQLINFRSDDNRIAPVEDGRAGEWRADDPRSDPIRWLTIARYGCRSGAVHNGSVEIRRSRLWSWLDS